MEAQSLRSTLIEQGNNALKSMNNLKRKANKKGQQRADLFENYRANEHSFRVYTYADPEIGESKEVQAFLEQLELCSELFRGVDTEQDKEVDNKAVKELIEQATNAYENMAELLQND